MKDSAIIKRLRQRLDNFAIEQLRTEINHLAQRVEYLEQQLAYEQQNADLWQDAYIGLYDDERIGITKDVAIVHIANSATNDGSKQC